MRVLLLVLIGIAGLTALAPAALAQRYDVEPRFGAGFDVATAILDQNVIPNGPSLGIRGRVALPVNADVSVAASLGIGAHLFEGADEARYVMNPQASVIVTLPSRRSARYVLGGFGGFIPLSDGGGGPSIHAGYGWAIPLTETSLFVEINPSLVVGEREAVPVIGLRSGVIF